MGAKTPSEDALAGRYRPRLEADLDAGNAVSAKTRDDRAPVALDQSSVGRLSRMVALQQQAMAAAQDARRQGRARAIRAALERLDRAEFGWCEECGGFIGRRRLDQDPTLSRCVDCAR